MDQQTLWQLFYVFKFIIMKKTARKKKKTQNN